MPKKNTKIETEEMEMMESLDEEIQNEILLQENTERGISSFNVSYKKDKKIYNKKDAYGANLDKYRDLLEYGALENTSVFIKSMKLEKGLLNVKVDTSLFHKAVIDLMHSDFKRRITVYNTSDDTNLEVKREKNSYRFVQPFDKESIIARAKELRAECFNLLTGEGNPERSNPKFVKEITEIDENGIRSTRLAYDEKAVEKFVKSFQKDKNLYKNAISNIKTSNFHSYYNNMEFKTALDKNGNKIDKFGYDTKETASEAAEKYARDYLNLKEIHKNRPWHYWFTSPLENIFEGKYLKKIHNTILDAAKGSGFGDEMKQALSKSNKKNVEENLLNLKKAVYKSYKAEYNPVTPKEEPKVEEIKDILQPNKERIHIEINNDLIDPVSDVEDELHPFAVHGYGMGEATKYLTEEEFLKENNPLSNPQADAKN